VKQFRYKYKEITHGVFWWVYIRFDSGSGYSGYCINKNYKTIKELKMKQDITKTFQAKIYVGFLNRETKKNVGSLRKARKLCQEYVDGVSLCVTLTPTEFIYVHGREKGVKIGLINYPRFPEEDFQIKIYAMNLAEKLMIAFQQCRVSIVMPSETIMLTNPEIKKIT